MLDRGRFSVIRDHWVPKTGPSVLLHSSKREKNVWMKQRWTYCCSNYSCLLFFILETHYGITMSVWTLNPAQNFWRKCRFFPCRFVRMPLQTAPPRFVALLPVISNTNMTAVQSFKLRLSQWLSLLLDRAFWRFTEYYTPTNAL